MTPIRSLALAAGLMVAGAAVADIPPIGQVPRITEGLIDTAIAYEVDRVCDSIDGRRLQGLAFLLSLQAHARSIGFSQDEVDAYIDDGVEKDRLEAIARERMRGLGAIEGEEESYCVVGRAEIARGSQIGALLND